MNGHLINIVLLCLSYLTSLLLFQYGFLLKRTEIPKRSECTDVSVTRHSCWLPARYHRAVVVIIDALRYDFAAPLVSSNLHFHGRLPTISRLLVENGDSAALMHFTADPPTTTMQRLKGFTTGSLPTFIDVGSNFASSSLVEDNWVDQIYRSGRNITFLGDDTWISLFPVQFFRSYHLPSFDINDLHSVDNLIFDHIYEELARPDWSVLIAHFLGVDHCGHKYGPDHPEMARKLFQMDQMIGKISEAIDNDTLLVVMGDHGMTQTGDHGGDTESEVDAALFIYSRKKLLFSPPPAMVSQVDLVPTLSLLLDSPIPFSNIGVVIDSFIPPELLPLALSSNARQMSRYGYEMISEVAGLDTILRYFDAQPESVNSNRSWMLRMQALFRSSWTQFNIAFMCIGFLSLIDAAVTNFDSTFNAGALSPGCLLFRSGLLLVQISTYLRGDDDNYIALVYCLLAVSLVNRIIGLLWSLLSFSFSFSCVLVLSVLVIHAVSFFSNSYIVFEASSVRFLTVTVLLIAFFHSSVKQRTVFPRSSRTKKARCRRDRRKRISHVLSVIQRCFGKKRLEAVIGLIMVIRLGELFERCREEQQDACVASLFSTPFTKLPSDFNKAFRFGTGVFTFAVTSYLLSNILRKFKAEYVTASLCFPCAVLTIVAWTSQWLPEKTAQHFSVVPLMASRAVYFLSLMCIAVLCVRVIRAHSVTVFHGCSLSLLVSLWTFLGLLLGDGLSVSFAGLMLILYVVPNVIHNELDLMGFFVLLSSHGFFALSHHATFASIPWQAAFVGVEGNFVFQGVPAALIIAHLFSSQIVTAAALPLSVIEQSIVPFQFHPDALPRRSYFLLFLHSWKLFAVCAASFIHRRHLMVWKIFAPKFIFESVSFCVTCVVLIFTNFVFCKMDFISR